MTDKENQSGKRPAIKKDWIVPIRLTVYAALAGTSAYVFFNYKDLVWTEFMFLVPIIIVGGMVSLDCKMSQQYWDDQEKAKDKEQQKSIKKDSES